ncbi:MAG: hypothetical protein J6Q73_05895 [Bacteroidaceae bacterium]|nr:hypothetical protein [Bacteroidaceae bacterium]
MQKKYFTIAGHNFAITMLDGDIFSILPNLKPFESESTNELLFEITSDNSIQPSWRGCKVGTFPCPSAKFEVYRQDSGAYQILTINEYGHPCAFMQSDAEQQKFTITTRGSKSDVEFGFNNTLMVIFTMCTARHSTLLMHSATIENSGKGYMFLGASGQGKSTHSNKWVEYIKGSTLINDDNPIIRIANDGTPFVYGSPWSGKRPIYMNVQYPIGGMAAIEQDKKNWIRKENIPTAFGIMLCSCSTLKFDKEIHIAICNTITKVLERIPVHTLFCRPDEEAALLSSSTFGL